MDPILTLLLGLAIGAIFGGVIGVFVGRARRAASVTSEVPAVLEARHAVALSELRAQEGEARAELATQLAAAQASLAGLREQLGDAQEQYRATIERSRHEAEQRAEAERAESKVLQALSPVQESLRVMQDKVTDLESQRNRQHGELAQQLKSSSESEERLRATTESLASALRNNATRGVWGETQLRTLVESAGLINQVDFFEQRSITADGVSRRPDLVVKLPGGKLIAVDAKVPYNSFIDASAIPATATGAEEARRKKLLDEHAKQMKSHVDALAAKSYWSGLDTSPEFTIAFIPNESLLAAALDQDPKLLQYAFDKRVALSSPVTFWSVLKTIAFAWEQEKVTQEAKFLFDLSRKLYSQLATLAERVDKLGRSIDRSVKDYNAFVGTLERSVYPSARKLNMLDESAVLGTALPLEEGTRKLTAIELTSALEDAESLQLELPLDETEIAVDQLTSGSSS